jgi:hypothetical protein
MTFNFTVRSFSGGMLLWVSFVVVVVVLSCRGVGVDCVAVDDDDWARAPLASIARAAKAMAILFIGPSCPSLPREVRKWAWRPVSGGERNKQARKRLHSNVLGR